MEMCMAPSIATLYVNMHNYGYIVELTNINVLGISQTKLIDHKLIDYPVYINEFQH